MALVGTAAGYLLVFLLLRVLPRTPAGLGATAFLASVVSVVVASQSFVLQYALGGATPLTGGGLGSVAAVMAGTHLLIGIGEGLIAATTVVTVAKTRPDLVYALRSLRRPVLAPRVPVTGGVA
jgi:cobalt/nickel transport system permease protein